MNKWIQMLKNLWQRRSSRYIAGTLVLVLVVMLYLSRKGGGDEIAEDAYRARVQRGDLVISILQTGELEAKKSRDILNEASGNAKIVEIVEDGAYVTNGQLIVELESADLADRTMQQRSSTATAEADLLHSQEALAIAELKHAADLESAKLAVELAELDLQKYTQAEYPQLVLKAESDITLAEQELKQSRSELEDIQELYEKGYATLNDLESNQLNVDRREIEVRNKTKDLEILQQYTYVKTLKELENSVSNAKSALERLEKSYVAEMAQTESRIEAQKTDLQIQQNQLATRERELENTKIFADFSGQVFYPTDRRGTEIEEGATVNYRQQILSYPDLSAWNLKVGVPEAMIDKVALGQEAVATLDAVPGLVLRGRVNRISAVPDSQRWFSASVKTYTVMIDVSSDAGTAKLKPGMSATVEVVTDQLRDVLYVPIQSVVSEKDKHYVYIIKRNRKELREVQIGKYNTQFIEIIDGVEEGEELLLYAEVEMESNAKLKKSPLEQESNQSESSTQEEA